MEKEPKMGKVPENETQGDDLEELYGIKIGKDGWIEHSELWQKKIEDAVRENFELTVDKLSNFTSDPNFFLRECRNNKEAVIYAISRTPVADREDEPNILVANFEKNAALSVCGTLKININEDEQWHTDKNRSRVEWEGWNTNPADKKTPIHDYYNIKEDGEK